MVVDVFTSLLARPYTGGLVPLVALFLPPNKINFKPKARTMFNTKDLHKTPDSAEQHQHRRERNDPPAANMEAVNSATPRDVLSGRGQGVQRHGGNVKYRHLVYVNKGELRNNERRGHRAACHLHPRCGRTKIGWHWPG